MLTKKKKKKRYDCTKSAIIVEFFYRDHVNDNILHVKALALTLLLFFFFDRQTKTILIAPNKKHIKVHRMYIKDIKR